MTTLKKSLKYLIIAFINIVVLRLLVWLSTDKFDLLFKESYIEQKGYTIIFLSLLSLIIIRIVVFFTRKTDLSTATKTTIAAIIMVLICSPIYVKLILKYKNDILTNKTIRTQIIKKTKKSNWFYGTTVTGLTLAEYQEICKIYSFPKLPKEASYINYNYEYEGFLPDYALSISYSLPKVISVKTIDYKDGQFSKSQSYTITNNIKRVTYKELQM